MNLISKYLQDTKIQTGLSERFLKSGVNMNMGVFQSNVLELMRSTPDLSKATPESVVAACLAATMMGLKFDKNQGQAYVIPYYNKKTDSTVAQLQIGWRGYKSLAIQSGKYKRIGVTEVYDFDDDEAIYKRLYAFVPPIKGSDNQIIGYVAAYELSDGYTESHFMSVKELNDHYAIYASGSEIWKKHPGAMRKKTVLRHLLRAGAPLGGCENQNYVNQGLSADGKAVSFDDETGFAIIEGQYQDNTQYESQASHAQMQGTATNIPKMSPNAKQFEKLLATLHKTPDEQKARYHQNILHKYVLSDEQFDALSAVVVNYHY